MKSLLISIIILIYSCTALLADTTTAKYYPLRVGNFWVYKHYHPYPVFDFNYRVTIADSLWIGNHLYYKRNYTPGGSSIYLRMDTLTGYFVYYSSGSNCYSLINESIIDSISQTLGTTMNYCTSFNDNYLHDLNSINYFGLMWNTKQFVSTNHASYADFRRYGFNLGLIQDHTDTPPYSNTESDLTGCYVNGVSYGDTNLVTVLVISNYVPNIYELSQNYPNPFNPVTKIKFDIPSSLSFGEGPRVRLLIYDVLGREVATLINEQLQPGSYSVDWDASNYPSGVYFYKLVVGDAIGTKNTNNGGFTESKKMLLVK